MQDQYQHQFILFKNAGKGKMKTSKEEISLTKSKVFSLRKGFLSKNNIHPEKYKFAGLYYNPEENTIAIRFITNDMKGVFKVTYSQVGAVISCGNFLKAFKIDINKYAGSYSVKKHHIEGAGEAFVIDLKERIGEYIAKKPNRATIAS